MDTLGQRPRSSLERTALSLAVVVDGIAKLRRRFHAQDLAEQIHLPLGRLRPVETFGVGPCLGTGGRVLEKRFDRIRDRLRISVR